MIWLISLVALGLLFVLAVGIYGASEISAIPFLAVPYTPKDFGLAYEDVSSFSRSMD